MYCELSNYLVKVLWMKYFYFTFHGEIVAPNAEGQNEIRSALFFSFGNRTPKSGVAGW